jgi:hypothetical protein
MRAYLIGAPFDQQPPDIVVRNSHHCNCAPGGQWGTAFPVAGYPVAVESFAATADGARYASRRRVDPGEGERKAELALSRRLRTYDLLWWLGSQVDE